MEARVRTWVAAVTEECARISADAEAMRIIEEVQRAEWTRRAEAEAGLAEGEAAEAARDADAALKEAWVREVERQYEQVGAEAEEFLAQLEQQEAQAAALIEGVDPDIQGEWVQKLKRQYSRSLLEDIEDEDDGGGAGLERQYSDSQLTAIEDEGGAGPGGVQREFERMARLLVRETSNFLAEDDRDRDSDEGSPRHRMVVELPMAVVKAQMATRGLELEGRIAELLAVQEVDAEDEAAMCEVDAALEEEWVERVDKEAAEVQDDGDAFLGLPSQGL